jgi:hypothetical protein
MPETEYPSNFEEIYKLVNTAEWEPLGSTKVLLKAETLACESFEWAMISKAWLATHGKEGLTNAIRCATRSATDPNFCCGWLDGAEAWYSIAQYDKSYIAKAREVMATAEADIEYDGDACCCAKTWKHCDQELAPLKIVENMKRAEQIYWDQGGDATSICRHWLIVCGQEIGGEYARRFRAKLPAE